MFEEKDKGVSIEEMDAATRREAETDETAERESDKRRDETDEREVRESIEDVMDD